MKITKSILFLYVSNKKTGNCNYLIPLVIIFIVHILASKYKKNTQGKLYQDLYKTYKLKTKIALCRK